MSWVCSRNRGIPIQSLAYYWTAFETWQIHYWTESFDLSRHLISRDPHVKDCNGRPMQNIVLLVCHQIAFILSDWYKSCAPSPQWGFWSWWRWSSWSYWRSHHRWRRWQIPHTHCESTWRSSTWWSSCWWSSSWSVIMLKKITSLVEKMAEMSTHTREDLLLSQSVRNNL